MVSSIGEIMTEKLETINQSATARDVAKRMADQNISSLIVADEDGKCIGIVTERDLVRRICANDASSSSITAKEVMSSPLATIDPYSTIESAADVMIQNGVRHLLVVDEKNTPLGIVTSTDFSAYLKENMDMDEVNAKILQALKDGQ